MTNFTEIKENQTERKIPHPGKVAIVGAGPGAVDLLTLKALREIENADVILYDNLVGLEIRQLFPSRCKKIYVGKKKSDHSIPQSALNALMISLSKQGQRICRLKGGDPFIFGRGSEEALALKNAGISVEIVPGITAASGCTSYAGIPLTHRGISQGCTFVTGHADRSLDVNWSALCRLNHTLVFYMGLSKAEELMQNLIAAQMPKETPVALIENGTTEKQRQITGELEQLPELARKNKLVSPCLIVIGETIRLQAQLDWFEKSQCFSETQTIHRLSA